MALRPKNDSLYPDFIFPPSNTLRRRDLAPFAPWEEQGCQGFIEPDLSTLRYKIGHPEKSDQVANVKG